MNTYQSTHTCTRFQCERAQCECQASTPKAIGFLASLPNEKGFRVICLDCAASSNRHADVEMTTSRVYPVNVYPYRQSCCECKKVLVAGQSCGIPNICERTTTEGKGHTHWCELFAGQ
jgi:hypothetical protein